MRIVLHSLFIVIVLTTLLFTGVVHALVPHDHDTGDRVMESIHALVSFSGQFAMGIVALVGVALGQVASERKARVPSRVSRPWISLQEYLSRGIAQHRRFG